MVFEQAAQPGSQTEAKQLGTGASVGDVIGQFAAAAWRDGIEKPVQGVAQLAGMNVKVKESDQNLTGAIKAADAVGSTVGVLFDYVVLAKAVKGGVSKANEVAASRGVASPALEFLAKDTASSAVVNSGITGFLAGSVFTPVKEGESQWWRLGQGAVDAGTFMAMTGAHFGLGTQVSYTGMLKQLALSGAAGGAVHHNLDSWTHWRMGSVEGTIGDATSFAVGNVLIGAGMHGAKKLIPEDISLPGFGRTKAERAAEAEKGNEATERLPLNRIVPTDSISMRELARVDETGAKKMLREYYPRLKKAFPLEGEIETQKTYWGYLTDPKSTWDMVVLKDGHGKIAGGIQYQVLDVQGEVLKKAAWGEHIWVQQENRNADNFRRLLKVAQDKIQSNGADTVFMEFNNIDKMTRQQIKDDARGGITTQDRELVWGRTGVHVAVDSTGKIAEYGQPSMDGQPPVPYLSLGFVSLRPLTNERLPVGDYLKLAHMAHSTIPGVDIKTDPIVRGYTDAVNATGEGYLIFKPLAEIAKARRAAGKIETEEDGE